MSDLVALFHALDSCTEDATQSDCFRGTRLSDDGNRHLGKDRLGRPAILIRVTPEPGGERPFGADLENLRVEHGLQCRITGSSGQVATGAFTLIQCLSTVPSLQEYFLRTIEGVLKSLTEPVRTAQINLIITNLVALFRALGQPASKPAAGLWAELFFMARSNDPKVMLCAWHSEAAERYDFSWESQRIEVKASTDRARNHYFSYEQAYPPASVTVLVVSLFVQSSPSGKSIQDLWDHLRTAVAVACEGVALSRLYERHNQAHSNAAMVQWWLFVSPGHSWERSLEDQRADPALHATIVHASSDIESEQAGLAGLYLAYLVHGIHKHPAKWIRASTMNKADVARFVNREMILSLRDLPT